jgi:hypothetical protein
MVDYDETWEIGRHAVFHRAKCSHDAKIVEYLIDPTAATPGQTVRTDLNVIIPSWYIGVHPMGNTTTMKK